ncbi:MAG: hypothetical protein PHV34_20820 [Verrucomicrobiae bacterium]|nr:hypothetical protein [Verrucomicrobiae bacterium]
MKCPALLQFFINQTRRWTQPSDVVWSGILTDGAILGLVLGAANVFFDQEDLGWFVLHPSPYFLMPVLLGCRYGFMAGVCGGGGAAAVILFLQTFFGGEAAGEMVKGHFYLLFSFFFAGGLCGEIQEMFAFRLTQQDLLLDNSRQRLRQLDEEIHLAREAKEEVERTLATIDAEVSTLDFEIRRLYQCTNEELYPNLLGLLSRWGRVQQAAVYGFKSEKALVRHAYIGSALDFPEEMSTDRSALIHYAIEQRRVVSLAQLWKPGFTVPNDYLIAVPLVSPQGNLFSMVVVNRLPFTALNQRTLHSINLICRWSVRLLAERREAKGDFRFVGKLGARRIYGLAHFEQALKLAFETWRHLQLPSSAVLFYAPGLPANEQKFVEETLMQATRAQDTPTVLDRPVPHLLLFLPLTGERGAALCRERVMKAFVEQAGRQAELRGEVFLLSNYRDVGGLMAALRQTLES